MRVVSGYAAQQPGDRLEPWTFGRRDLRAEDVALRIDYCGICHSDLHALKGEHSWTRFPLVPGHEIVGEVMAIGAEVSRFAVGDKVVLGTIVDSCRTCAHCEAGEESYCLEGVTTTYDGVDRHDASHTFGGYSSEYVAAERFVHKIPAGLDPAGVAPLMCAGITTWAPLRRWGIGPGATVGIVGLGGLGHVALKLAAAMGAKVVLFTTSAEKADAALALGADEVVLSSNEEQMAAQAWRHDFILDTVPAPHSLGPYLQALKLDGTLCLVGLSGEALEVDQLGLVGGRRSLASSAVGGTVATREMLDFCAEHGITAEVELVGMAEVNEALDRLARNDVRYRFVIDMAAE